MGWEKAHATVVESIESLMVAVMQKLKYDG